VARSELPGEDDPGVVGGEHLLDPERTAAVLMGPVPGQQERTALQAAQLAKNGVPLLACFPLVDEVLTHHEIDMARADGRAPLQTFNPILENPAAIELCRGWIRDGHPELGAIELVTFERSLDEKAPEVVVRHFARDSQLLEAVANPVNRLSAHGADEAGSNYHALSVQLVGKANLPVRWSVVPREGGAEARLTLVGERGRAAVEFDAEGRAVQLVQPSGTTALEAPARDAASAAIARFAAAIQAPHSGDASNWPEAVHAMELADTIEISLRRGRMIEVHDQQLSEDLAFRGTMSALGCGVLLLLPPVLVLVGWVMGLVGLPVARYWPHVLLVLLALFLSLQAIPKLLFSKPEQNADPAGD
ncbi:MAG: hypothetical protein AAGA92_03705, partial [Planctomycetota bacterium]